VINAGGMLNASGDIFGQYDINQVMERVTRLYDATLRIFEMAKQKTNPPMKLQMIWRDRKSRLEGLRKSSSFYSD
jgi:hypothetical protein